MIPGVWLEIEVMGIKCPLADQKPEDWYFIRHGKKVSDRSRYQLDFRNPAVREHAAGVIDRLVRDYHVGYIKMDYNIEPGVGTQIGADSFGEGLLGHERAYLGWLDGIFEKYPDLVIENCSSGDCGWITPCSPGTAFSPPRTRRTTSSIQPLRPMRLRLLHRNRRPFGAIRLGGGRGGSHF